MQRSPIDLPYIVYDPPTVIITLNSNTGIHVRYVPVVRYIVNSTEFQYISMHLVCGCPLTTAHPFFVRTPHNHTSMESARSEDSNGVWYVFNRAHSAPIEQLTYYSIYHYDSSG